MMKLIAILLTLVIIEGCGNKQLKVQKTKSLKVKLVKKTIIVKEKKIKPKKLIKVTFSKEGLIGIIHNEQEFFAKKDNLFRVGYVRFISKTTKKMTYLSQPKPKQSTFSLNNKTLTQVFDWGRVVCRYEVKGNSLHSYISVENKYNQSISDMKLRLMRANFPVTTHNKNGLLTITSRTGDEENDDLSTITAILDGYTGKVGLSNWSSNKPINYSVARKGSLAGRDIQINLPLDREVAHPVYDLKYFKNKSSLVFPGESLKIHISIDFGNKEDSIVELSSEVLKDYAKKHPQTLKWKDRRPIGAVYLANSNTGWLKNPRGYIAGGLRDKEDMTTTKGLKLFHDGLMAYADRTIKILKDANAQGVIIWDIEGAERPHFITYVGQPSRLAEFAPEMDRFADEFFKQFTDAGLKTGVCIRPTDIFKFKNKKEKEAYPYQSGGKDNMIWHREVKDPGAWINKKISYAKKRWGCTLFYLDSNVCCNYFIKPKDGSKVDIKGISWQMPIGMYKKALKGHSDILLIPEWSKYSFFSFSAPYYGAKLGQINVAPLVREAYPNAFAFIATGAPLLKSNWNDYAKEVAKGSILSFNAWYPSEEFKMVKMLYKENSFKKQGVPDKIKNAKEKLLLHFLNGDNLRYKYFAIKQLAKYANSNIISKFLSLFKDKNLLIRKVTIETISKIPLNVQQADQRLVKKLIHILINPKNTDEILLQTFAGKALGKMSKLVAVPVFNEWLNLKKNPNKSIYTKKTTLNQVIRVFANMQNSNKLIEKELLNLLTDKDYLTSRKPIVETLGKLKSRKAVPTLLKILKTTPKRNQEALSCSTVKTLGEIGDKSALPGLMENWDRQYSTVVVYRIKRVMNNALKQITGENLFGSKMWKKWWKNKNRGL